MTLVTRAEHDHWLAVRGGNDLARIRRHARALGQRAEIERLEMRERRVLALDVHHRLARLRDLAVVQRAYVQVRPARLPESGELVRELEDFARDRLVVLPRLSREGEPPRVQPTLGLEVTRENLLRA